MGKLRVFACNNTIIIHLILIECIPQTKKLRVSLMIEFLYLSNDNNNCQIKDKNK